MASFSTLHSEREAWIHAANFGNWSDCQSHPALQRFAMRFVELLCLCLILNSCTGPGTNTPGKTTFSSFDRPIGKGADQFPAGHIVLEEADVTQVLNLYSELSGRTVIRSPKLPATRLTLRNANAVNRIEALQLLDTTLATSGIVMILSGDGAVKAVPAAAVPMESPPIINLPADQLPDSKSVMVRHVRLNKVTAEKMTGIVTPFASLPNSIIGIKDSNTLILRDYSSTIRQMLRVIEDAEKTWAERPK